MAVADEAVAEAPKEVEKNCQGSIRGHDEQGVRDCGRGLEFGDATEDDGEDDHSEEGTHDGPGNPHDGLLVADENVPPRQEIKQLAVAPEVAPVVFLCASGFDNQFRHYLRIEVRLGESPNENELCHASRQMHV